MIKHLSPLAILFFLKDQVRNKIGILPAIIIGCNYLNFLKGNYLIQIGSFVALILLLTFLEYFFFTYEISEKELIIRSGVFEKKEKHIPYSRIQTIHTKYPFWMEPLKQTKVILETANQDDDGTIVLRVVSQAELERLQDAMKIDDVPTILEEPSGYYINNRDLAIYTITSPGVIVGALMVYSLYEKLADFDIKIDNSLPMIILFLLIGIGLTFFNNWQRLFNFSIHNEQNQLKSKSGLFSKTQMTFPVKRIQGIIFEATYLRYLTKLVSIQAIASSKVTDEEEGNVNLIPVVKRKEASEVLHELLPTWPSKVKNLHRLSSAGKRSLFIYRFNWLLVISVIINVISYFFLSGAFVWILGLNLLVGVYNLVASFILIRSSGVSCDDQYLYLGTKRYFKVINAIFPREKIQYLKLTQSVWMKKKKLMHIELEVMDKHFGYQVRVRYLPEEVAKNVQKWFMEK